MIRLEKLRLYNQTVNGIRYIKSETPFLVVYFSENSTFVDDYHNLNIRFQDVNRVIVPYTRIPRTYLSPDIKKQYRNLKLTPYQSNIAPPSGQNLIYDVSNYLKAVDSFTHPKHYRQKAGMLIKNIVYSPLYSYPDFIKVLMYSIDMNKPFNKQYISRKIFPFLMDLKKGDFDFDYLILNVINNGSKYRLLIKDKQYLYPKVLLYLRYITSRDFDETEIDLEEEEIAEPQIEKASEKVVDHIKDHVKPNNLGKIKDAVKTYLKKDYNTLDKINSGELRPHEITRTAISSILFKSVNNIHYASKISASIPEHKLDGALKKVDKVYVDQLLEKSKTTSTSDNVIIQLANVPKMVDNKNPSHLFDKRLIDFQINLKNDIVNSFKTLETKEIPLKIESFTMLDKIPRKGETEKSDESTIIVKIKDKFGHIHKLEIDIPKIDPMKGTFRLSGRAKCLINQIVLCPISFPKKYESRFESSYSIFRIYSKVTKKQNYLQIYMGSFKNLPLMLVLAYGFGFEETLRLYGINYKISTDKPTKTDIYACKLNDTEYIYFSNVDTDLKEQLCNSFITSKVDSYNIKTKFGSKEYFEDILQAITGSVNITYLISTNFENIVDPVARQILISKGLPSDLELIMKYMATKVISGNIEDRNDLNNQRIRGSEVLVQLLQKQILSSYTVYKEQVLSGNKDASFIVPQKGVLSQFLRSEIVSDMEYANPVEEMAVMTRISPVGKGIGGIPNKEAIQDSARNVHPSYFGNIDPVDTPEGPTIGILQQLAIGSDITNARGLFKTKEINDKEGSGILSTSSALIPFIENNEGARIMMADSQVKQMLPLKNPEPPIVMSGYESILTNMLSSNFIKRSPIDGRIIEITTDYIMIQGKDGKEKVSLVPIHLKSGFGRDALSIFIPKVKEGQAVKKDAIIAEGSCVKDGSIALGRTFLVAYMPYKGYNYEDGIVINEKIISEQKLVSLHGIEEEILISEKDRILYIATMGERTEAGQPLVRKTLGEIEELLGFEEDNTTIAYGQELVKKSPGGVIVDIDVFCNTDISRYSKLKELSERTKERYGVAPREKFSVKGKLIKGILIKFRIEQELVVDLGDKLTGRYGNKGVICLIEKDENMPKTPWGESVEIILNPIGVIGRMNLGQLYELYCGLISKDMAIRISNAKTKQQIINVFKTVLPLIDNTKNQDYSKSVISGVSLLNDRQFLHMVDDIKNKGFVPLIIPPFKAPSPEQIKNALKALEKKPAYKLFLPEYNTWTKSGVPVGYMYMSKLEHIAGLKMHARSTGPMTSKTLQPTAGKRREGGQRLGELDTYSIISYNATKLLSELMGPLSDDMLSKNEMISEIITGGEASFKYTRGSLAKDLLACYFIALMLDKREMGD